MAILLSSVPLHIKTRIVEKLELKAFANFQRSSRASLQLTKKIKNFISILQDSEHFYEFTWAYYREFVVFQKEVVPRMDGVSREKKKFMPLELEGVRFDARMVTIDEQPEERFCEKLIQYFRKSGSTIRKLDIRLPFITQTLSHAFFEFLLLAKVKDLTFNGPTSPFFIANLPPCVFAFSAESEIDDDSLQLLRAPLMDLKLTRVTNSGLNAFLRNWYDGDSRNLRIVAIHTVLLLDIDEVFRGIPHVLAMKPVRGVPRRYHTKDSKVFHAVNDCRLLEIVFHSIPNLQYTFNAVEVAEYLIKDSDEA